jgi:predicted RNase H-like HicB family nuclease
MNTYNAIIELDGEWYFGFSPEVPGANGQGRTVEECKKNLAETIELILEDLRDDYSRGLPKDAIHSASRA